MKSVVLSVSTLFLLALPAGATDDSFDVVVYGGTPGGISAALSAARSGRSVALVAYHNHLGGMMTSGLGKSDIEKRAMIGGLFQEMVKRVYTHYVTTYGKDHENVRLCREGYYYEPSVAESVLEGMIREQPTITVMKGWRLKSAEVTNNCLGAVEFVQRRSGESRRVDGRVFVDATYEGDLYAAAGAEFRLGREARDEYGEPHAGVIYYDYQAKRLLPGTTGAGDDRLPAYTYRLCLTTDLDNSHRLTKPPSGYDRQNYLAYFEDLKAGRLAGPKVFKPGRGYNPAHYDTLVRALSVTAIPNKKTDVNINPRPLGFPFVEENRDYITGNEATRQRIFQRHRELTLGLLWFLQNDPDVPEAHRKLANQLHLPQDEFLDSGHFPFQLYVREGRRLVGEYTLTEHDITGNSVQQGMCLHPDSVAIGEFPIDSFPSQKRQPGDTIVLEGYLGMLDHITRPYEIPYRIMLPKRINGLIVPVAVSITHLGFSSIRMVPTWMALGQAAGVAASLAVERGLFPRNVSPAELQHHLRRQGQVVSLGDASRSDGDHILPLPRMLVGSWVPEDPQQIDFVGLPRIASRHAVVSDVRASQGINQHNYLVRQAEKFWLMWSDGPGVEDRVGQRVKYATSLDELRWSDGKYLTPEPPKSGRQSEYYGTNSNKGFR